LRGGTVHKLRANRVYLGDAVHKGVAYPGEHQPIIGRELWARVHDILRARPAARAANARARAPALLKGMLFGPQGEPMTPTHTRKGGRLYRYYISHRILKAGATGAPISRVPAGEIETVVVDQVRAMLRAPEVVIATWRSARPEIEGLPEGEVRAALAGLDPLWDELFPAEQARALQLLVARLDLGADGLKIRLRVDGLARMVQELSGLAAGRGRRAAA
jgi:hypothetical protein